MVKEVRVNLFDVEFTDKKTQPLSDTIGEFERLGIGDRWRDGIRLDYIEHQPADQVIPKSAIYLEFTKQRSVGPGRLKEDEPIKDFDIARDEYFGEETSALFVPSRKWLLILNNHYGAGPSRMAAYFNALDPGSQRFFDYQISPRIDSKALERMRKMQRFSQVEVSAKVGVFDVAADPLLESVHEAAGEAKAMRISLTLHANEKYKHGSSLTPNVVRRVVNRLLKNQDDVDRLVVTADDPAIGSKDRIIDLIEHKIHLPFTERDLQISVGRRYTRNSKISLLRRSFRAWFQQFG